MRNNSNEQLQAVLKGNGCQVQKLIELLEDTNTEELLQYPDNWIALYAVYQFSKSLLLNSAFIPRLLELEASYRIQWIPADMQEAVKNGCSKFIDFCPSDILLSRAKAGHESQFKAVEQLRAIVDIFLGYWIAEANHDWTLESKAPKVLRCFFERSAVSFNGLTEKEIPKSIQQWLRKFYIQHKRYLPLLQIEESEDAFLLQLKIEDHEGDNQAIIDLNSFLNDPAYRANWMDAI